MPLTLGIVASSRPKTVTQSLWSHAAPLGTGDTGDTGVGVVLATRIRPTAVCTAHAAWFQKNLPASGSYTASLWEQDTTSADRTLLAQKTEVKSGTGWHRIQFDTPVALTVPTDIDNWGYVIGVWYPGLDPGPAFGYFAQGAYFATDYDPPGPLMAPLCDTAFNVALNGRFSYTGDPNAYPVQQFNSGCYFIDIEVTV